MVENVILRLVLRKRLAIFRIKSKCDPSYGGCGGLGGLGGEYLWMVM